MPTPLTTVVAVTSEPDEKPSFVDEIYYHEMRKPFIVPGNFNEESFECMNSPLPYPKPAYIPSWEKMYKLLSRIPSFIERKPLVQNMEGVLSGYSTDSNRDR